MRKRTRRQPALKVTDSPAAEPKIRIVMYEAVADIPELCIEKGDSLLFRPDDDPEYQWHFITFPGKNARLRAMLKWTATDPTKFRHHADSLEDGTIIFANGTRHAEAEAPKLKVVRGGAR